MTLQVTLKTKHKMFSNFTKESQEKNLISLTFPKRLMNDSSRNNRHYFLIYQLLANYIFKVIICNNQKEKNIISLLSLTNPNSFNYRKLLTFLHIIFLIMIFFFLRTLSYYSKNYLIEYLTKWVSRQFAYMKKKPSDYCIWKMRTKIVY